MPITAVINPPITYEIRRGLDRKSTRLNSSHGYISYAVFCLKKKKKQYNRHTQRSPTLNNTLENLLAHHSCPQYPHSLPAHSHSLHRHTHHEHFHVTLPIPPP